VPARQFTHDVALVAEYVPIGQEVHEEEPVTLLYVPAAQLVHIPAPPNEYVPAEQLVHDDAPAAE
jgi:hypothetical protein